MSHLHPVVRWVVSYNVGNCVVHGSCSAVCVGFVLTNCLAACSLVGNNFPVFFIRY